MRHLQTDSEQLWESLPKTTVSCPGEIKLPLPYESMKWEDFIHIIRITSTPTSKYLF